MRAYSFLELCTLVWCKCICLGYDWDNVDLHSTTARKESEEVHMDWVEMKLTFSWSCFINAMSICFSL